ncbi:MAG TPA: glycosyltransferase family 2 protein [Thermoanaerobaculia bacterium]|nr:glycosyltransferase family 2 protein [Thermoanaerobaculia bacterium]
MPFPPAPLSPPPGTDPGSPAPPELSVVIPVFNGAATLPELLARLAPVLAAAVGSSEVILVNDGSRDGSWETIASLAAGRAAVRGIDLMRNYGQHNALLCGIRAASGALILTLDDDLQHPPEEIPRLLAALAPGIDVVYGTPLAERHGLWRDAASRVTKFVLQGAMGAAVARQVSAFRLFRTELREAFAQYGNPYVSVDVLLTWATTRFTAVPVRHEGRRAGRSNYTLRLLVRHALNMITGFSVGPLKLASLVGFASTLLGLAVLAYVVGRYLIQGTSVPGFPFLASLIAIFSGAQLFTLGIIGEYLARMHFSLMSRPIYTVRRTIGAAAGGDGARGGAG